MTLIITSIILALLVVPIWLLYHFSVTFNATRSNVLCMGVLLVATLVFSAVLSLFTKARRHEVLAASAGYVFLRSRLTVMGSLCMLTLLWWKCRYCAVLVVFVGNIGNAGISDGMSLS